MSVGSSLSHIGQQREKAVSHHMPEINHAMRPASQEAGAEHNVGTILENRCEKERVFVRVILQIGVLNDYDLACSCLKPRAKLSLAQIALL